MAKSSVTTVPYDRRGNLMHYPRDEYDYSGGRGPQSDSSFIPAAKIAPDWRPNDPFTATLTIDEVRSGRSAKYLMWTDADGCEFPCSSLTRWT